MKIITEPAEAVTKYRKSVPPNVAAAGLFTRGGGGEGVLRNAETNRPRLKREQAAYFACSDRSSPPVSRALRESVSFPL